jgi:hypothetical protein
VYFYGNGIQYGTAAQFFYICNGQAGISVWQYTYTCYIRWQNSPTIFHIVEYFDMRLRQHLYVNGCMSDRGVEPLVYVPWRINFGPEGTASAVAIRIILDKLCFQALPSTSHSGTLFQLYVNKHYSLRIMHNLICCYSIILFQDMCLLNAVQRYLGSFVEWPAEIQDILFIQYPPPRMLRKLVAFFFGNGAPCPLASKLFHACNIHSSVDDTETIYKTYKEWEKNAFDRHLSKYNRQLRKYVYLNGKRRDQNELVSNMMNPVPLGIYNRISVPHRRPNRTHSGCECFTIARLMGTIFSNKATNWHIILVFLLWPLTTHFWDSGNKSFHVFPAWYRTSSHVKWRHPARHGQSRSSGHPLLVSRIKYNYQCVRCHGPLLLPPWFSHDQSQLPITLHIIAPNHGPRLLWRHYTPRYLTPHFQYGRHGGRTCHCQKYKNSTTNIHGVRTTKLQFSTFWGLCPGPTEPPPTQFWETDTFAQSLGHPPYVSNFSAAFFTVMHKGLITTVQSSWWDEVAGILLTQMSIPNTVRHTSRGCEFTSSITMSNFRMYWSNAIS